MAPMRAPDLDLSIAQLPYFRRLRPEEHAQVASRFTRVRLAAGEERALGADAALVLALRGEVRVHRDGGDPFTLDEGDWSDDLQAVAGRARPGSIRASLPSEVALLDRAGLDAIFEELPAAAVPLMIEIGREIKASNDLLRDVSFAHASGLPSWSFEPTLRRRRKRLQRHRRVALRRVGALLARALFVEPSRRPTFWIFWGAVLALVSARTMVAVILRRGLQHRLFALIGTSVGHPIHVHHFNYGLTVVAAVGALSLLPRGRSWLRLLSFAFGFGVGLVADEFALLWNLNPDYYQPSSRFAAALVIFALLQAVYFRRLYLGIARRLATWGHWW
jgi:hypothetical protein